MKGGAGEGKKRKATDEGAEGKSGGGGDAEKKKNRRGKKVKR